MTRAVPILPSGRGKIEPGARSPGGMPLLRLGFRPFYLLAALFAVVSIVLWTAQYAGWLGAPHLEGPLWHAHEMLFGYTMAVIAGFLFTAVRNWTARPTPTGALLAAIVILWLAGRVLVLTPFGWTSAVVNAAFPLAIAAGIGVPLAHAGNRRNFFFVALLVVIAAAVLAVHMAQLGALDLPGWIGIQIALDVVLFVMSVMGGRVIPMFTNNGVPGARAQRLGWLEKTVLASTLLVLLADSVRLRGGVLVALLVVVAGAHAVRLALWTPWRTLRVPLVWVLHAGYAWIPIHLGLRALVELDVVASPLATHALTIGAIGGLTIGMMTRTARGHTGRPLQADRFEVTCFALVLGAALVRVFLPLIATGYYLATVVASAVLWAAAYAVYAIRYWPILTRPRLDGKPG